jgi:DNA-binding transcriptional ArsR family regulator
VSERRVDRVFSALADPTRRAVLRAVADSGDITTTQLSAQFPVSRQAVAKHLSALSDAGLVSATRRGRETFYALTPAPLTDAVDWITGVGAEWDDRLKSLQGYLARRTAR